MSSSVPGAGVFKGQAAGADNLIGNGALMIYQMKHITTLRNEQHNQAVE